MCLIMLNEPKTSGYGGVVAAPIFRETTKRIAGLDNDIQRNLTKAEKDAADDTHVPSLIGLEKNQSEYLLDQLNIPFEFKGKAGYVTNQSIEGDSLIGRNQKIILTLSETYTPADSASSNKVYAEIPELRGMNMRAANNLLGKLGFQTKMIGSGTVYAQYPLKGEKMRLNSTITLRGKAKSLEFVSQSDKR